MRDTTTGRPPEVPRGTPYDWIPGYVCLLRCLPYEHTIGRLYDHQAKQRSLHDPAAGVGITRYSRLSRPVWTTTVTTRGPSLTVRRQGHASQSPAHVPDPPVHLNFLPPPLSASQQASPSSCTHSSPQRYHPRPHPISSLAQLARASDCYCYQTRPSLPGEKGEGRKTHQEVQSSSL